MPVGQTDEKMRLELGGGGQVYQEKGRELGSYLGVVLGSGPEHRAKGE